MGRAIAVVEGEEEDEEEEEEEEEEKEMNDGGDGEGQKRRRPKRSWLPLAARLIDRLSTNACWKELEALSTVLTAVTARIGGGGGGGDEDASAADCAPLAAAARQALSSRELSHGPAVRSLVALLVSASRPERGEDLEAAHDVSRAVAAMAEGGEEYAREMLEKAVGSQRTRTLPFWPVWWAGWNVP